MPSLILCSNSSFAFLSLILYCLFVIISHLLARYHTYIYIFTVYTLLQMIHSASLPPIVPFVSAHRLFRIATQTRISSSFQCFLYPTGEMKLIYKIRTSPLQLWRALITFRLVLFCLETILELQSERLVENTNELHRARKLNLKDDSDWHMTDTYNPTSRLFVVSKIHFTFKYSHSGLFNSINESRLTETRMEPKRDSHLCVCVCKFEGKSEVPH